MPDSAHNTSFLNIYTEQMVLWKHGNDVVQNQTPNIQNVSKSIERFVQMGQEKKCSWYILLGAQELYTQELILRLKEIKSNAQILILDSNVNKVRNFKHGLQQLLGYLPSNLHILVDSSPWALYLLTLNLNLESENCSLLFCEHPKERSPCLQTWRKLFLGSQKEYLSDSKCIPSISLHVIIHPQEPHTESFFAHIPHWIKEVLVLWDSDEPIKPFPCAAPVRHYYRLLQGDFSAQRNTLLEHSTGQWIFYLDADERLDSDGWDKLKQLAQKNYDGGVFFVRMTFEGDDAHIRMGHGLWPDIQLRLFPHTKSIYFKNPVHEQVMGLENPPFLCPSLIIWHYSHIFKKAEELRDRLEVYNNFSNIQHKLSVAYPSLPKQFFIKWQQSISESLVLRLPI